MHGAEGVPTEGVPTALGPGDFFLSYEENQVTEILPYCIRGHEKITDVAKKIRLNFKDSRTVILSSTPRVSVHTNAPKSMRRGRAHLQ